MEGEDRGFFPGRFEMLRVNNIDLSPQRLMQNFASPQGPLPPPNNTEGGAESQRIVGVSLIQSTLSKVNTARVNGAGGNVDMLA